MKAKDRCGKTWEQSLNVTEKKELGVEGWNFFENTAG
jgi:hypothetical protein